MSNPLQRKKLPAKPSLEHLQKQAKRRVKLTLGLKLAAAQHQLAQEYGYKNWAELVRTAKAMACGQEAQQRFKEAQRLTKEGKLAEALSGMLWCFDKGMRDARAMSGVRRSFLLSALVRLGELHPPALQALSERRDQARLNLSTAKGDDMDWPDFVSINHCLGEDSVTLAFYDQAKSTGAHVPPTKWIYGQLLDARRYTDAVAAKSFETYLMEFTTYSRIMSDQPSAPISYLVTISGQELEALAGAGDLISAQAVVTKMLQTDKSTQTLATLRLHATRAGHPELIPANRQ